MAEASAAKWKTLKNKSFVRLPPDADSLHQHCLRANYLAYLVRHLSKKHHPSPLGHGWELVGGHCRPVRHTQPALPTHLPASGPAEESDEDESEVDDSEEDESKEGVRGMVMYRGGGRIHQIRMIQNLVRQNALIQTDNCVVVSLV